MTMYRSPPIALGYGHILAIVLTTMVMLCIVGCLMTPVWGYMFN